MPTRWSGAESRLLYRTADRKDALTEALDQFEQSDAPAVRTLEEAKLFADEAKKKAWETMNSQHDTTWTYLLSWVSSGRAMDARIEQIARERLESSSLQLQESKDRRTRELEYLYRDQGFHLDITGAKVLVIKELLGGIAQERARLNERVRRYGKLKHLVDALKNDVDPQEKALSIQQKTLQELLTETQKKLYAEEKNETHGMREAKQNDDILRGTILNALDLSNPEAQEILAKLDEALLENVLGNYAPLEQLIGEFARQDNVSKEDVNLVIHAAGFMRNNPGYVRLYREKNYDDNERVDRLDLDVIMQSITTLPLGSTLTLGNKPYTVLKQDAERGAVIVRMIGGKRLFVIDPTPMDDGSYRALQKDPEGATRWVKVPRNSVPTES